MPIQVNELSNHFRLFKWEAGLPGSLRSFFNRNYKTFQTVKDLSIHIKDGGILEIQSENAIGKASPSKLLISFIQYFFCLPFNWKKRFSEI